MNKDPRLGRVERARHALLLFVLYFFVPMARGHGILTVGLTLVFPEFPFPGVTGWIGFGLLAIALFPGSMRAYRGLTFGAILLLCCSILLASADTDLPVFTWIFSAPFAAYAYFWMRVAGWRFRRATEGHG
jgi:hypothetical protein